MEKSYLKTYPVEVDALGGVFRGVEKLLLQAQVFVHVPVEPFGVYASAPASPPPPSPVVPAGVARGRARVSPVPAELIRRKYAEGGGGG